MEAMDRHPKLKDFFKVTALATDRDGGVYVANLEARDYPITATQWHPVRRCLRPSRLWLLLLLCGHCVLGTACYCFFARPCQKGRTGPSVLSHPCGRVCMMIRSCISLCRPAGIESRFAVLLPAAAPVRIYMMATRASSWAQEKNAFEFAAHLHIPHSPEAVSPSFAS